MEAPFRYPIAGLADVERLLNVLGTSPQLVAGSLRLVEGRDLLTEQLTTEGRPDVLPAADTADSFAELVRALWEQPLGAQRPRFLRFNAELAGDPGVECSMRIDVPSTGDWPRWIDLEGSRDPAVLVRLRTLYRSIAHDAQLAFLEV